MKTSESIAAISKALSEFQKEVKNPENIANNPFYKSKYAPLPEVLNVARPILGKYGLAVIQNPYTIEGQLLIETRIVHESGEWIETEPLHMQLEKNTPQGAGSAITYGRRYSLSAVLGLASEEDDDGNEQEPENGKKKKTDEEKKVEAELAKIIKEIGTKVASLIEKGVSKDVVSNTIKGLLTNAKGEKSANYNAIKDITTANKVLDALQKIGG